MSRLWERMQHLAITQLLTFQKNAQMKVDNALVKHHELKNIGMANRLVTHVATGALVEANHEGRINLLGEVGGNALVTLTLPPATGSGARYPFLVSVVNTSNYVIQVTTDDIMQGNIIANSTGDTPDLAQPWAAAADSDTITLNGTTSGGASIGDRLELVDILPNTWAVSGVVTASGTEATPFSAAVS